MRMMKLSKTLFAVSVALGLAAPFTSLGADAAAAGWSATVEADDVNDALVIKATGDPAQAVRWVAHVRVVELIH